MQQRIIIKRKKHNRKQILQNMENIRKVYDNSAMARFITSKMSPKRKKPISTIPNKSLLPNIKHRYYADDDQINNLTNNSNFSTTRNQYSQTKYIKGQLGYTYQPFLQNRSPALSTDRIDRKGRYFIFRSSDDKIKKILQREGWIESKSKNSIQFSLKWIEYNNPADYLYLRQTQYYNHIKNFNQSLQLQQLIKHLKDFPDFYPKSFDLAKDTKQFLKNFDMYGLLVLLKKHIEYFKIKAKHLIDNPIDISIVDILKLNKFTQTRSANFLINIPLIIQACLYYQQLLYEMGLNKSNELQVKLDPRNVQSLVNYSKINPPYQQYQTFKYSNISQSIPSQMSNFMNNKQSTKQMKQTINFSRDYQRFSSTKTLDTPSDELVSILIRYSRMFKQNLDDYEGCGINNNWILINKQESEKRDRIINTKNLNNILNPQNYIIQKMIEKQLKILQDKFLKVTTFVLIIIKQNYKIYFLNKHIAKLQKKIKDFSMSTYISQQNTYQETYDLETLCLDLNLKQFYSHFSNKIKDIVLKSLKFQFLDQKRNCFQIIRFNTIVDQDYGIWLQSIQNNLPILNQFMDQQLAYSIGAQMLSIILDINYTRRTYYKYWNYLQKKITSKEDELHNYSTFVKDTLLQTIKNKLSCYNNLKRIGLRYQQKVQGQIGQFFRMFIKHFEQKKTEDRLDICLGSSILQRIFKKKYRQVFEMAKSKRKKQKLDERERDLMGLRNLQGVGKVLEIEQDEKDRE